MVGDTRFERVTSSLSGTGVGPGFHASRRGSRASRTASKAIAHRQYYCVASKFSRLKVHSCMNPRQRNCASPLGVTRVATYSSVIWYMLVRLFGGPRLPRALTAFALLVESSVAHADPSPMPALSKQTTTPTPEASSAPPMPLVDKTFPGHFENSPGIPLVIDVCSFRLRYESLNGGTQAVNRQPGVRPTTR